MKKFFLFIVFIAINYGLYAQPHLFVRIYSLSGKKIMKGTISAITDSSLTIGKNKSENTIPVSEIGFIKTKHSEGNNILIGSVVGTAFISLLGIATADPDDWLLGYTAAEGALLGPIFGAPIGAAIGGISILFKSSRTYIINGDAAKWKQFTKALKTHKQKLQPDQ